MSSETSTDPSTFRPWHLFTLAGLLVATVGVLVVRPGDPAALVLLVAAIFAAAGVGLGIYRTIWPLTDREFQDRTELIAGRTRAALDREKTLVLRSLKELEFDRAMGKVSDRDFSQMGKKLRARAMTLMKQLDVEPPSVRAQIERELADRLRIIGEEPIASGAQARPVCGRCGGSNESDAKFCKSCGASLNPGLSPEEVR